MKRTVQRVAIAAAAAVLTTAALTAVTSGVAQADWPDDHWHDHDGLIDLDILDHDHDWDDWDDDLIDVDIL